MRIRFWLPLPGPFALTGGRGPVRRPKLRALVVIGILGLLVFAAGQVYGWW